MSSEQHVEDLLSAYLDNALTQDEYATVAAHVQTCTSCNEILADFRYFDALLAKQPRISPTADLRERIFSSSEYKELVGEASRPNTPVQSLTNSAKNQQTVPQKKVQRAEISQSNLVSIPGTLRSTAQQETKANIRIPQHRSRQIQRLMQVMIAASLLLTVGIGSFIGWSLWHAQNKVTQDTHGILPPQDLRQGGPLPAGMRSVFVHDGSLWSAPADGHSQAVRLTPATVTVAPNWVVRPALPNSSAGNLIMYVNTRQGLLHVIRSDGQSDTAIQQPLLKDGASSSWNTDVGSTILSSLSWSPDGTMLAFLAAPTGIPALYTYTVSTGQVQAIAVSGNGAVSHPRWSPNSIRIAFESTHNNVTSILDYNSQTHSILTVVQTVATASYPDDSVLTLDWATSNDTPAITWSVGSQGHIHSIWLRSVGVDIANENGAHILINGDYTQAIYSRAGDSGMGGWILIRSLTPTTDRLLTLALTSTFHELINGNHIQAIQWLSDGKHISYLALDASNTETLHSIDVTYGNDTLLASGVSSNPRPSWSPDGQRVLYSAGTHSFVADISGDKTQLSLQGPASTFLWSTTVPYTAIVVLQNNGQGVYLCNTQNGKAILLSKSAVAAPIMWTQIP